MNPNAFKGTLIPEPNNFTIEVDRLILRDNEIVFEMHGRDNETGPYDVEGKCFKQRTNYYKGPGQYRDPETKVVFDEVESFPVIYILEYTLREYGCDIEGLWFERVPQQEPIGGWLFSGSLEHLGEVE